MRWWSLTLVCGCTPDPATDAAAPPGDTDPVDPDDTDRTVDPGFVAPPCDDTSLTVITTPYPYVQESIEGLEVLHFLPEEPRAVIFAFHGGGGSVNAMMGLHQTRIWDIFGDVDVGLLSTDSFDRVNGDWDFSGLATNVDMQQMAVIRDHFIATGEMTEETPIWAWGFSAGGGFTRTFLELGEELGWPVRGAFVHAASWGRPNELPAFFTGGANDVKSSGVEPSYQAQLANGAVAEYHANVDIPWTSDTMLLDPGYDAAQSQEVFDELVALDVVDAAGDRIPDVDQAIGMLDFYPSVSRLPGPIRVSDQLRVNWALHRVTSEFACEERDFLLTDLGLL